eukprot:scaffold150011_cov30-Tisochrysis_lutea.AAC.5
MRIRGGVPQPLRKVKVRGGQVKTAQRHQWAFCLPSGEMPRLDLHKVSGVLGSGTTTVQSPPGRKQPGSVVFCGHAVNVNALHGLAEA